MTDPFTLRVNVGGQGGKRWKEIAALRGSSEAKERYGEFTITVGIGQVLTFYTSTKYEIKRVGWTTKKARFWIVAINPDAEYRMLGKEDGFHIAGHFDILADGDGKTKALRLLKWWLEWEPTLPHRRDMALHLGRMIKVRGLKEPQPMFEPGPHDIMIEDAPPFNPAEWDIEIE